MKLYLDSIRTCLSRPLIESVYHISGLGWRYFQETNTRHEINVVMRLHFYKTSLTSLLPRFQWRDLMSTPRLIMEAGSIRTISHIDMWLSSLSTTRLGYLYDGNECETTRRCERYLIEGASQADPAVVLHCRLTTGMLNHCPRGAQHRQNCTSAECKLFV
jgi:hypothetical protein